MTATTTDNLLPAAVRDGPATSKLVWFVLNNHGPATVDTLQATTGQSCRSVQRALSGLEDRDLVEPRPDPRDPRRQLWESRTCSTE